MLVGKVRRETSCEGLVIRECRSLRVVSFLHLTFPLGHWKSLHLINTRRNLDLDCLIIGNPGYKSYPSTKW